jgi:hypothetical protein
MDEESSGRTGGCMSRKDYIKVAAILKGIPSPTDEGWHPETLKHELIEQFAEMFAEDNDRFDYYKFKNAVERR